MIIADTNIWIDYLNRPHSPPGGVLAGLLQRQAVCLVGPVLAELLQGARNEAEQARLERLLDAVPYVETDRRSWLRAGALSSQLRAQGQVIPLTDLVIAAVALEQGHQVYSLDDHFQRVPGLKLYEVRAQ